MRKLQSLIVVVFTLAATGFCAPPDACANPNAPRIGVIAASAQYKPADNSPATKRSAIFDIGLRDALMKRLQVDRWCVVTEWAVLGDPKNFPALKGVTVFQIQAAPSFKNEHTAAISVEMFVLQGPNSSQNYRLGALPVLIEAESDFDFYAKAVLKYWTFVVSSLSQKPSGVQ